jgi:hypothetical protein
MENQNEKDDGVRFELDGVLYADMDSAIEAAKPALRSTAEEYFRAQGQPGSLAEFGVRIFNAVEPPGAVVIEAAATVTDASGKKEPLSCLGSECKFIREVDPFSPTYGKYVPKTWSRKLIGEWLRFDKYASFDHYDRTTPEEVHYCCIACWIEPCLDAQYFFPESPHAPFERLVAEINRQWKEAKTDLERNQAAEYLLCAQDLELVTSFHEILHHFQEVAARAEELARIREAAKGQGNTGQ